ncbi:hypothetical protein Pmani_029699 [Petrolisthes manimaculis]|uniref:Uncharacterized protein n=1 Tax=Petrolisthes manimaculis TaxID=1843537 RepID=A0AAE1NYX1_9EUCA|nr:hypothetical protein Pmani_029699 [Petrolisthes manimaculis]
MVSGKEKVSGKENVSGKIRIREKKKESGIENSVSQSTTRPTVNAPTTVTGQSESGLGGTKRANRSHV